MSAHTISPVSRGRLANVWVVSLVTWVALLIATPIGIWLAGEDIFPLMATLGVLAHGTATLSALAGGWPAGRILRAVALVFGGAWAIEALGSTTGYPFGSYEYTDALQPQLAGVPLLIPLAWLMMLIPAWGVAEAILAGRKGRWGRWYAPLHAMVAGAAFTAWDLYLDPQMVARGLWLWDQPGGYFGIPWVNFLGWWLAATVLTLIMHPTRLLRARLIAIYTLTWAFQAVGLGIFWGQPGPALSGFLAMGVFVVWAWYKESPNLQSSIPTIRKSNLWTSSPGP